MANNLIDEKPKCNYCHGQGGHTWMEGPDVYGNWHENGERCEHCDGTGVEK